MFRVVFASALLALLTLVAAPAASPAAGSDVTITSAEMDFTAGPTDVIDVIGFGTCTSAGFASIQVTKMVDLDTGAIANPFVEFTNCTSPGEHVNWLVRPTSNDPRAFRPGDRVSISVSAAGAITGTDQKVVVLQQLH